MLMPRLRREQPHTFYASMVGVRMGDRFVQIGCADGDRLAALAAKVGISGRALLMAADEASAKRAAKGAAHAGVLVEVDRTSGGTLPLDGDSFDLVVFDDVVDGLSGLPEGQRRTSLEEALRVLRPGGRAMIIGRAAPTGLAAGLAALLASPHPPGPDQEPWLVAAGFKGTRRLAERSGLAFIEGLKSHSAQGEPPAKA